jgi:hypothetical protein
MRILFLITLSLLVATTDGRADNIDFSNLARSERQQLAKCFSDFLQVLQRHKIREGLLEFLESGCKGEIVDFRDAVKKHWPAEVPDPKAETFMASEIRKTDVSQYVRAMMIRIMCGSDCMKYPSSAAIMMIYSLEERAIQLYKDQGVSFCSGDECLMDIFRKCMILQISDVLPKRPKPRDFEKVAQANCKDKENAARGVLTIDLGNAQRLQQEVQLSERTRALIDGVFIGIRHAAVVSYAEDLTKVVPGRKSCKTPMCGDRTCISLEDEPEYNCAIAD